MIGQFSDEPLDVTRRQKLPSKPFPHVIKPGWIRHVFRALRRQLQLPLIVLTPQEPPADGERNAEIDEMLR